MVFCVVFIIMYNAKSNSKKTYWTQDTENAIIEYNNETDDYKRNILFENKIYPALLKLSENVFNVHKISYSDFDNDKQRAYEDGVTFLSGILHKFKPNTLNKENKNSTAYSYFNRCIMHYYFYNSNKNYKNQKKYCSLEQFHEDDNDFLEKILYDQQMNNVDVDVDTILTSKQGKDIEKMFQFWKNNTNIKEIDRQLIDNLERLIYGKIQLERAPSYTRKTGKSIGKYSVWITISRGICCNNTAEERIRRLMHRYYIDTYGCDTVTRYGNTNKREYLRTADEYNLVAERICPGCGKTLYHRGQWGARTAALYTKNKVKCSDCNYKMKNKIKKLETSDTVLPMV